MTIEKNMDLAGRLGGNTFFQNEKKLKKQWENWRPIKGLLKAGMKKEIHGIMLDEI